MPKISLDYTPHRVVLAAAQLAEQLVEEPTVVSPPFFSQLAEQNADLLVLSARGSLDYGGLHGFLPEESPTTLHSVEQNVDIPVPGARSRFTSAFCRAER